MYILQDRFYKTVLCTVQLTKARHGANGLQKEKPHVYILYEPTNIVKSEHTTTVTKEKTETKINIFTKNYTFLCIVYKTVLLLLYSSVSFSTIF
jgi:hypothetical protein